MLWRLSIIMKNKECTRYFSNKQEEYIANLLNCKRQCGSGSTPFAKGDVIADNWLFECKTTTKPKTSFSIKKDWIDKNFIERVEMGKPYSAIVYQYEEGGTNYFVLDETTFKKLYERFEDDL